MCPLKLELLGLIPVEEIRKVISLNLLGLFVNKKAIINQGKYGWLLLA